MRQRFRYVAAMAMAFTLLTAGIAVAHPDHALPNSELQKEDFAGEGVAKANSKQPAETTRGSLPPVEENVALVGRAQVTNPSDPTDAGRQGRVTDVFGYDHPDAPEGQQSYAYLGAFIEPTCEATGVHVMDINDLSAPFEVEESFIPTSPGSYVGEGVQVIRIGDQDVLIHQNETCVEQLPEDTPTGGISLHDVTDPLNPETITTHVGDSTGPEGEPLPTPNDVHSFYAWNDEATGATYAALIDNFELTDVDILDISDPANPVLINDTLDLAAQFGVEQDAPDNLTQVFSHDMDVTRAPDGRYILLQNYWDGGYVLLDVTDPTEGNVSLIQETDFEDVDPELIKSGQEIDTRGEPISPEGNAHQGEVAPNFEYMVNTDEDFAPYRISALLDDGTEFPVGVGTDGGAPPQGESFEAAAGDIAFLGDGCTNSGPVLTPGETGASVGMAERGGSPAACTFTEKITNIQDAGYDTAIIVNSSAPGNCSGVLNMSTPGDISIPSYFVGRDIGFQLFGSTDYDEEACQAGGQTFAAGVGDTNTQGFSANSDFEGWGYIRLYDVDIDAGDDNRTITEAVDTFAVPESQDPAFAEGFGDLSVHEVALDPDANPTADSPGLAYSSYYAAGLRVLEYGPDGLEQVGAYVSEDQSNLWGVEVYDRGEDRFILASDRDFGLYVFDYLGDGDSGIRPDPDELGPETDTVIRVSGDDRIETAIEVSQEFFGSVGGDETATAGSETATAGAVVLSRADIFPDSLSGSPLAIDQDAPLLLTVGDGLDERTAAEMERVLPPETGTVYLLGGEEALSADVESEIEDLGYEVVRYGGRSRYETAAIIARDGLDSPDTVLLTDGNDFPDAVSAGAAGGAAEGAVLLTGSETPSADTDAYLAEESRTAFAVGGPAAAAYPDAQPLVGESRFETGVLVAEQFFETTTVVGLATGGDFADALAGGAAVGRLGGPLLLVGQNAPLPESTGGYLEDNAESIDTAYVFGGVDAIGEDVVEEARDAIADEPGASPDELQAPPD